MTKNPYLNAFAALGYIALVASVMFYGSRNVGPEDTIVGPIAFMSLFTFSAAVMGYLFLYQPFLLYFDGKKKHAIDLFLKTMLVFGSFTALVLFLLFSGILSLG